MPGPGSAIGNYVKSNAGNLGMAAMFNAGDLSRAGGLMKGMLGTMRDFLLMKSNLITGFAALFLMVGTGIHKLIKDTGALEAALRKLSKIQELSKAFEPLYQSAKKANEEVAKLVNFAKSKNLRFDTVADAAKVLATIADGAMRGTKQLERLADAAAGTGNSLQETSSAIAAVVDSVGSGIGPAVDNLRQMRVISGETAESLKAMEKNGAGTAQVIEALNAATAKYTGESEKAKQSIEGQKNAFKLLKEEMAEGFGQPFADKEVERIKNWTFALKMAMPIVEGIGEMLAKVAGLGGTLMKYVVGAAMYARTGSKGVDAYLRAMKALEDMKNRPATAAETASVTGPTAAPGFTSSEATARAGARTEAEVQAVKDKEAIRNAIRGAKSGLQTPGMQGEDIAAEQKRLEGKAGLAEAGVAAAARERGARTVLEKEEIQRTAPAGTSTAARYSAQRATTPAMREYWETQARLAEEEEGRAVEYRTGAIGLGGQKKGAELGRRQAKVGVLEDVAAQGSGAGAADRANAQEARGMFDQLLAAGYSPEQATKGGTAFAQKGIELRGANLAVSTQQAAAVSELARIGGGGGVEQVNASVDIQRQQLEVARRMDLNLKIVADSLKSGGGEGKGWPL